jgi:hypothetical protein
VAPPLVGVAVKVIEAPEQVGLLPDVTAIATEGTRVEFTDIVIGELVAVVGLAQVAVEVIIQVTF